LALFWPLLARSACAQLATLMAGTAVEGAELASVSSVAWAHTATVVADPISEGAALTPVRFVSEGCQSLW
jgi:hypothetical protein